MSNEHRNQMGPVMDATSDIQEMSERDEVIYPAIDTLYRKHYEHKLHRFNEENREKHIANWKVTKYAEEHVAYGTNYFLKVSIGDGLFIHIRVHRPRNHDKYDFYSLHEIIRHNVASCVFTEDDQLTYFNY